MSDPAPLPAADPRVDARLDAPRPIGRRVVGSAGRNFWALPLWKKVLLFLAITFTVVGIAGAVTGSVRSKPPEVKAAQQQVESLHAVGPRSSLTNQQQQTLDSASRRVNDYRHWFYDQTAPQLWRIGLGFFIAFVLGFMARQFLKTMATLAAIAIVLAGVAIYFGMLDSGGLKSNVTTGTGWVMDRLDTWKASLLTFAGTSLSGTAGFLIGFMRSK